MSRLSLGSMRLLVIIPMPALALVLLGCRPSPAPQRLQASSAPSSAAVAAPPPPTKTTQISAATTAEATAHIAGCALRFAASPEHEPTGLTWQACATSSLPASACRELALVTPPAGGSSPPGIVGASIYAVGIGGPAGAMLFVRIAGLADRRERYVLGPPDGPARMVMTARCTPPSSAAAMAIGEDGAALQLASASATTFLAGPFANDPSWRVAAASYGASEHGEVILDAPFAVAARSIRAVDARMRVFRSSPATRGFQVTAAGAAFHASLGHAVAAGDTTLFESESIPETLAVQIGGAAPAPWFTPPAGGGVSAPAVAGGTVYVFVGTGRDKNNVYAGNLDLFATPVPVSSSASPSPSSPAAPALRHVGAISPGGMRWMPEPVAGGGHVAWRASLDPSHAVVDVMDVATGHRVRFTPPASRRIGRLVYVDAEELGVSVVEASAGRSMTAPTWTWRVRLSALPAAP